MPRAEKEAKVREIAGELQGAQAAVLTGYRGLTVQESGDLRAALAEVETRLSVVKNSLAMLAAKEAGLEGLTEMFDGPTAVAYVQGDAGAAAKRIVEQARRYPVLDIRGGFAEGRILDAEQIRSLATLETREVMLAKIAGLGKSQIARAAFMFQALQSRFLLLLKALQEKLPEEPAAETAAAEPAEAAAEPAAEETAAPAAEDQPDADRPADAEEPEGGPAEPEPGAGIETEPREPEATPAEQAAQSDGTEGES